MSWYKKRRVGNIEFGGQISEFSLASLSLADFRPFRAGFRIAARGRLVPARSKSFRNIGFRGGEMLCGGLGFSVFPIFSGSKSLRGRARFSSIDDDGGRGTAAVTVIYELFRANDGDELKSSKSQWIRL